MGKRKATERLELYRSKRSTQSTPEPFGSEGLSRPRLFVVQKHAATRLHYDFRLEWGGTLLSWAVPKGPCLDPSVKRFAVQVEDHPVDYADFEGIIPKGNYGAGEVIVWDKGLWLPLDDPDELQQTGKLHFELRGYKLRGTWLLIRMQGKDWLLRKKPDAWSSSDPDALSEESVHSGLTLEELREGSSRASSTRKALEKFKASKNRFDPMNMELMLAETADAPFSDEDWVFELKYDGYRMIAWRPEEKTSRLRSRNGHDMTETFPEVSRAIRSLPYTNLILDGEIVVLDDHGRPNFKALQKRGLLTRKSEIEKAAIEFPVTYFAFDLLGFEEYDLRRLTLWQRKQLLQPLIPRLGPIRYADHIAERGEEMFQQIGAMDLEGIMAKKADSTYRGGRTRLWQKIVVEKTEDFVVVGFTHPKGHRPGFGALHLAIHEGKKLVYAGRVGTGFNDQQLQEYRAALDEMVVERPAFEGKVPSSATRHVWVRPDWVVEVRFREWTADGMLRAPAFLRLRNDKDPKECRRETVPEPELAVRPPGSVPEEPRVKFTNLDKVFWPQDGYRKGDLIDYYRTVATAILPYLVDRPLVLTRYPDGIEGKSFYQKNAPEFVPRWIRRVNVWSESGQKEIEYFVCDDEESLLYIANMGSIPLHIWPSRASSIQHPDFCLIDLDPKTAPFKDVLTLARAVHELCQEIELPDYVKTTGSTGLHILIPLGGQCTFEQSRMLGQLISRIVESRHPDIATTARTMSARRGRVYLDYLQNRHGQLLVAPYSVRPFPGAPVSAPLEWKEVNGRLTPQKFNIANLPKRLKRKKEDPLLPILNQRPDLVSALARLAEKLAD